MEWDDVKGELLYQLLIFFFFSLMQSVGAVFAAQAARQFSLDGRKALGALVGGAFFAGIPFLMSVILLRPVNSVLFFIQAFALLLVFLGALLLPEDVHGRLSAGTLGAIGLGIPIMGLGATVGLLGIQNGDILFGACWAGLAGLVGLGFFSAGLQSLISGKPLGFKRERDGTYELVPAGTESDDAENDAPPKKAAPKKRKGH